MSWSWKIVEIAGIGVRIHATFLLLVVWLGARTVARGESFGAFASVLSFVLLLFGCIVLHELGHALAARRFGIGTRDITLLPIGGVARLERMPRDAKQEFLVAMAGPAVNLAIAAGLFAVSTLLQGAPTSLPADLETAGLLERLIWVNVALLVFNLVPAFPMDGGRALRALLATRLPFATATRAAAGLGQGIAVIFGLVGVLANPFLVFIALFVWIGAAAEVEMVELETALRPLNLGQAMLTEFHSLRIDDPLSRGVELTLASSQKDFPVVQDGVVRGIVTQGSLVRGLARDGGAGTIGGVMEPPPAAIERSEPLGPALERMQTERAPLIPVVDRGRFVGIVTVDNVFELIRFRSALEARVPGPPALRPQSERSG